MLVVSINLLCIFAYGCVDMVIYNDSEEKGDFSNIVVSSNPNINYNDYVVTNWGKEPIDDLKSEEILSSIKYAECKKINDLSVCIVSAIQTKHNSICKIEINKIDSVQLGEIIHTEQMNKIVGSAIDCEIVEICDQCYAIVSFVTNPMDNNGYSDWFATTAYRINLSDSQVELLSLNQTEKEGYKRDFPISLTHYINSPFWIIAFVCVVLVEGLIVFFIGKRLFKPIRN